MPERAGIVTRAGHICMLCGFLPTTKNKYRELQDHLVRKHFNDQIKGALPTRRPYVCPEPSCPIEGKDWQALMRHYTGKHGILEAFLREIIDNGLTLPPNPKHAKRNQNKGKKARKAKQRELQVQQHHQPERVGVRRKRPSHNSTGSSSSSPDSFVAEEESQHQEQHQQQQIHHYHQEHEQQQQQPQHLALVVKQARANGEEAYALIDLKCLIASPTTCNNQVVMESPAPTENTLTQFNVLMNHNLSDQQVPQEAAKFTEESQHLSQQSYHQEIPLPQHPVPAPQVIQYETTQEQPFHVDVHQLMEVMDNNCDPQYLYITPSGDALQPVSLQQQQQQQQQQQPCFQDESVIVQEVNSSFSAADSSTVEIPPQPLQSQPLQSQPLQSQPLQPQPQPQSHNVQTLVNHHQQSNSDPPSQETSQDVKEIDFAMF